MDQNRRWRAAFVVGLALTLLGTVVASTDDGCDMKTVEKAFYCEGEKKVLTKKELVSKKTYFECEACKRIAPKSGKCKVCGKNCAKKVTGKGVCPACFEKPIAVVACVKVGYACPKCGDMSAKPAKCMECRATHKKVQVRAVIVYRCEGCASTSYTPGNCEKADCEKKGTPLVKACSQSGKVPHVKPAGKEKKNERKSERKKK